VSHPSPISPDAADRRFVRFSYQLLGLVGILGLGLLGCGDMQPRRGIDWDPTLEREWRENGQAEVEQYLQALQARRISVDSGEISFSLDDHLAENRVQVSAQQSEVYARADSIQRPAMARRLGLVIWDNLRYQNDYGEVWLIFRDRKEQVLGEYHLSSDQLRDLVPQLQEGS
jgi:hypothetical protein